MKYFRKTIVILNLLTHSLSLVPSPIKIRSQSTNLYLDEKGVREELKEKSLNISAEYEIKYGSANLENIMNVSLAGAIDSDEHPETDLSSLLKTSFVRKMERLTKPRAYPLFLAEKGAIIVEQAFNSLIQSKESQKFVKREKKERVVILGTGWGAAAFLKEIDMDLYDITVISPRNHFLFTPMLAGASVGTVEFRSITESIRQVSVSHGKQYSDTFHIASYLCWRLSQINLQANYLEGTASIVNPDMKTIECESVVCEGNSCEINSFIVEYDTLIFTVGAQTNTFGIPGVRENCCFLKQVEDARRIRTAIVNLFERANLPGLTDGQRKDILTFAVIGAGPTGVEFASELRDFVEQDGPKYYPNLLKFVRIKVIEASPTVLAPFDKNLQQEAIMQLTKGVRSKDPVAQSLLPEDFKFTELLLNSGVSEVKDDKILLNDGRVIPYGLAVWAAGNGPLPITLQLIEAIGEGEQLEAQKIARGRIAVDPWLRVLGGKGHIFAFGDCSCIMTGQLPATAQVASQQGEFLARLFSLNYNFKTEVDGSTGLSLPPKVDPHRKKILSEIITSFACQDEEFAAPFQFLNLGILAYTGDGSALAQLQLAPDDDKRIIGTGKIGFGLWRSVYLSKQISSRNRFLVFFDWFKVQIFGRDITRI